MIFGTVSYLSNREEEREFRWKQAKKSIVHFATIASWVDKPLWVVTTNWREENFKEIEELTKDIAPLNFIKIPLEQRGANRSKNALLKVLYDSDEDYLFTGDDDTWTYPHYGFRQFIEEVDKTPEKFYKNGVYMVLSRMANVAPYKEENMKDKDFQDNWVFKYKVIRDLGYPMLHFNTKKHLGKEVFAPEFKQQDLNYLIREDLSYVIENLKLGLVPRVCTAFISATIDFWTASTFNTLDKDNEQANIEFAEKWRKFLIEVYPKVERYKSRWVSYDGYLPVKFEKRVLVPRAMLYEFKDSDKPKKRPKKDSKKGLLKS